MIKIDPVTHLNAVTAIIQSKALAILIFVLALGMYAFPILHTIFDLLLAVFVYLFPFYLLFTLMINSKIKWAIGLVIWMGLSFLPMQFGTDAEHVQYFFEYLPVLFLVIFCFILNLQLKEWGYKQSSDQFPLWF